MVRDRGLMMSENFPLNNPSRTVFEDGSHVEIDSNAVCSNRPSQNENRKRVPVRLHPLSCDFSATSQISVIARPRACAPRPIAPAAFGFPRSGFRQKAAI
jgi:hypothetical protein